MCGFVFYVCTCHRKYIVGQRKTSSTWYSFHHGVFLDHKACNKYLYPLSLLTDTKYLKVYTIIFTLLDTLFEGQDNNYLIICDINTNHQFYNFRWKHTLNIYNAFHAIIKSDLFLSVWLGNRSMSILEHPSHICHFPAVF